MTAADKPRDPTTDLRLLVPIGMPLGLQHRAGAAGPVFWSFAADAWPPVGAGGENSSPGLRNSAVYRTLAGCITGCRSVGCWQRLTSMGTEPEARPGSRGSAASVSWVWKARSSGSASWATRRSSASTPLPMTHGNDSAFGPSLASAAEAVELASGVHGWTTVADRVATVIAVGAAHLHTTKESQ